MKIAIVGSGNVGATIAYTLVARQSANEVSLIDINTERALGEILDISHGLAISGNVELKAEGYEGIKDADVIVITAGRPRKPDETRLDLTKGNVKIMESVLSEVKKHYNGKSLFLIVSNPMDILTYVTLKYMGIDSKKVIGSGTVLDSARFKYLLSERYDIDPGNIHAEVIGEHGDSLVPLWSSAIMGQVPLLEYHMPNNGILTPEEMEKIRLQVISSGKEVIKRKGATFYAIALSVTRIIEAISRNSNKILSVATFIDNKYGVSDVCLSLPCVVNKEGIREIMPIKMTDEEQKKLIESAQVLKTLIRDIGY